MSNTNNKGPYYKLLDLLAQRNKKLLAIKKELEHLERDKDRLGSEAIVAYLKKAIDYKEKKEAVSDNLIAIEALKREIGYQEKAIAKTEERVQEERKREPSRIRDKYQPLYNEVVQKLHKALLAAEKLELEAQRIERESKTELGRLGHPSNMYQSTRFVRRVLLPNDGEGTRKYHHMGTFEKQCKDYGIDL